MLLTFLKAFKHTNFSSFGLSSIVSPENKCLKHKIEVVDNNPRSSSATISEYKPELHDSVPKKSVSSITVVSSPPVSMIPSSFHQIILLLDFNDLANKMSLTYNIGSDGRFPNGTPEYRASPI